MATQSKVDREKCVLVSEEKRAHCRTDGGASAVTPKILLIFGHTDKSNTSFTYVKTTLICLHTVKCALVK